MKSFHFLDSKIPRINEAKDAFDQVTKLKCISTKAIIAWSNLTLCMQKLDNRQRNREIKECSKMLFLRRPVEIPCTERVHTVFGTHRSRKMLLKLLKETGDLRRKNIQKGRLERTVLRGGRYDRRERLKTKAYTSAKPHQCDIWRYNVQDRVSQAGRETWQLEADDRR